MLSVVAWKYAPPACTGRERTRFHSVHVNILRRMLERHVHVPHRLICVTDDTQGLDPRVEALPCPPFPHVEHEDGRRPMSFPKLWNFSAEAARVLGPYIMSIDLDVVFLRDFTRAVERDEDFVGWCMPGRDFYQGGIYLHRTGTRTNVYDTFDPVNSPELIKAVNYPGSDQCWMHLTLRPDEARFRPEDGIYHERQFRDRPPPPDARLVQFSGAGQMSPWSARFITQPWVARNWH